MATEPKDKLIKLLSNDRIIPFIGAGFSSSVANIPGWSQLIKNGLEYARSRNIDVNGIIPKAEKALAKNNYLEASNYLKKVLNAPGFPFVNWIKEEFSELKIASTDLLNSVLDLSQQIIATTNYDTLLSSVNNISNRQVFVHSEYEFALNAIKSKREVVLHFHGVYEKPESIVLSKDDYDLLNKNLGYKAFLQKLFSDYHILFIGCSKDGVMDEDFLVIFNFMKEWFSISGNQHFILFHEKEVLTKNHVKLLTECNIETIVYGNEYKLLSPFINSINPNYSKREQKLNEYKHKLKEEFDRIATKTNSFTTNIESIDLFFSQNFKSEYDWVDSEKMVIFEKLISDFNEGIKNKRDKLKFTQTIIRSIFNVPELRDKVDLWRKYGDTPEKLNPLNYISTAILAYDCLLKIPEDVLKDIRFSNSYVIHNYFFDGYLGSFIREIQYYKKMNVDLEKQYKNDKYLFENLKRIIESLEGFLKFDPDVLYEEIGKATIVRKLPDSFIVVVTNKEITLRDKDNLTKIYAKLPLEKNIDVVKIEVLKKNDKIYIIGFNPKYCFYWRPEEDISILKFHDAAKEMPIEDIYCELTNAGEVFVRVKSGEKIFEFLNFVELKSDEFDMNFYQLLPIEDGYLGTKNTDSFYKGPFLFYVDSQFKSTELLSVDKLVSQIKKDKNIAKLVKTEFDGFSNLIDHIKVQKIVHKGEQFFLLKCRIHFDDAQSLFILFQIKSKKVKIVKLLHLPHSVSIAADYNSNKDNLELICGYLDFYRKEEIGEYICLLGLDVTDKKTIKVKRDNDAVRDVFSVIFMGMKSVIFNIEAKKLISYSIVNESFKSYEFSDSERIRYIAFY